MIINSLRGLNAAERSLVQMVVWEVMGKPHVKQTAMYRIEAYALEAIGVNAELVALSLERILGYTIHTTPYDDGVILTY